MIVRNLLSLAANWIVGLAVLSVVGRVVSLRVLRLETLGRSSTLWIGLSVVLGMSYVLHLFVRLQSHFIQALLLLTFACAVGSCARAAWRKRARFSFDARRITRAAPLFLAAFIVFLVVARGVFAEVSNFDSYLYHLQVIEYLSTERVVVGLANLHTRLGFESSIYNVASLFENGTWSSDGFRLANGFIMGLAALEWTSRSRTLARGSLTPGSVPVLLGVPVLFAWGLGIPSFFVASPGPDLCAALVAVVALGYLLDLLFEPTNAHAVGALVLCGLAMTFRPINAVLLAFATGLIVVLRRRGELQVGVKRMLSLASPAVLPVLAFWTHSTLVSGYPLYPSPIQHSPFRWAVPDALIKADLRAIESWAKKPGASADEVLGNWSWLPGWWARTGSQHTVVFALLAFSFALLLLGSRQGWVQFTRRRAIAVGFAVVPFAVWFMKAPDPRFGMGQIVGLAISPMFFLRLDGKSAGGAAEPALKWLIGGASLLAVLLPIGITVRQESFLGTMNRSLAPIIDFPLVESEEVDGITIRTPAEGDQCGRVKWCAPGPPGDLRIEQGSAWIVVSRN